MKPDGSTSVNIKRVSPCGGDAQHEKRHRAMGCDCGFDGCEGDFKKRW